ncbi:hypothetical protein HQQ94_07075 [Shewanella sp. VB17]|uniref:hypothetical protein n=1 Tax=Shewanella sp. VB17 TaxID=2739432 RepID=UPI0015641E35|nr:hypothetical protein [Shewanella sp. VB17]NRD73004.1 hypothetical protein [Shewanella sp. VB17]
MSSKNIDGTQESEAVIGAKELGYGGWLRFLKAYLTISMVGYLIVIIFYATHIVWEYLIFDKALDIYALMLGVLPGFFLSFAILKILKIQKEHIPNKITLYIDIYFTLSVVIYFLLIYLFNESYISEKPGIMAFEFIFRFCWIRYFKKSKRVLSYYGKNAEKGYGLA